MRIDQVDGRLVTRHQPTIGIRRRRAKSAQCPGMSQQAADVKPAELTQLCILGAMEQVGVAYTFRDEPEFLAPDYRLDPIKEYLQFYMLGVDGVFSDFGDTAVRARNLLWR